MTEYYQILYERRKHIRDGWQLTQRLQRLASHLENIEIGPEFVSNASPHIVEDHVQA